MTQQGPLSKRKTSAIFNIIAGVLFLGAGFNIFGASSRPNWMWLVLAALFLVASVWGML